jgi:protein TonB
MAYVDTLNTNRRYGTLALVGAIHVAAGYALVSGLAANVAPRIKDEFIGIFIPQPPKPIEEPKVTPRTNAKQNPIAPPPPTSTHNPFDNPGPIDLPSYGTGGDTGGVIGEVTFPLDPPSPPPPLVAARPARPKGNPGLWVTTNDYPQSAIRSEAEGVVKFRLSVGTNGRVTGCEVTGSSGTEALDQAACAKLMLRGKFEPASDGSGALVTGSYTGAVRWQLPKE